jgi:hypothetical protein
MHSTGGAESNRHAQYRRAGEMQLARFDYDRFVQRAMLPLVAFANENSKQNSVFWNIHFVIVK